MKSSLISQLGRTLLLRWPRLDLFRIVGGPFGRINLEFDLLWACLLFLTVAAAVEGAQIVDRPLDAGKTGSFSNVTPPQTRQQTANTFPWPNLTALQGTSWFGTYDINQSLANPVAFLIRLFADNAGTPAASPLRESTILADAQNTGLTSGYGTPWYSYSSTLAAPDLSAGTYWLSVMEYDSRSGSQWAWARSSASQPAHKATRSGDSDTWLVGGSSTDDMAFGLVGTIIPEPGTFALLISAGAAAAVSVVWRRRAIR
jgi:hypothetical protein